MDEIVDDFVLVPSGSITSAVKCTRPTVADELGRNDYLTYISDSIDGWSPTLRPISLKIHDRPELNYKEHFAHRTLVDFFQGLSGWEVTPKAYDIDTAFVAVYDSGREGPTVSFNAEYDALPGIGHACGHNLIAMASVAAALATRNTIEQFGLPGKVILFGTPAEEGGGGKIKLLKAGAYEGVDINLISHPGITKDAALVRTTAYIAFKCEYFGKEAHAAAAPWEGINALDALITAYNALSVLRQQTQPGDIIQGFITHGGVKPNIIHAYASGEFVVRSKTRERAEALRRRVEACFEGAAVSTGAKLKITPQGGYADHVPNAVLGHRYRTHFNALGGDIGPPTLDLINAATAASSDQGDISHALPSLSPGFWIRSEGPDGEQRGGPHTPDFTGAARTEEAHGLAMRVGKGLAGTAVDVLTTEGLLEEVKKEFEQGKKERMDGS